MRYPLLARYWDKLVGKANFVRLPTMTFALCQSGTTFVQAREGAMYLGFGGYVGTVSKPQITNQMMVSRKVRDFGYLNHNANLTLY